MKITSVMALELLSVIASLSLKLHKVLTTSEPQSIEDEIRKLESLRLRPADEIIEEADSVSEN